MTIPEAPKSRCRPSPVLADAVRIVARAQADVQVWEFPTSGTDSADPLEAHVIRLAKKVKAGADFIQTSCVYDMSRFNEWMKRVRDQGIHEKVHLLVGVMPLKSGPMDETSKRDLRRVLIPDALLERLDKAGNPEEEGIKLCIEQIAILKVTEGIHGIHLMTNDGEEAVRRITEGAGLLPRPKVG